MPVPAVAEDERLLVKPLELPGFFRVVARYGYYATSNLCPLVAD